MLSFSDALILVKRLSVSRSSFKKYRELYTPYYGYANKPTFYLESFSQMPTFAPTRAFFSTRLNTNFF